MRIELSGKQALVTGSTAGIGLAIATGLAQAGASVTVVGRDQAKVDKAVAHIQQASGRDDASGVVADAMDVSRDGASIQYVNDARTAVKGANAVYTDAWASMGQEEEQAKQQAQAEAQMPGAGGGMPGA